MPLGAGIARAVRSVLAGDDPAGVQLSRRARSRLTLEQNFPIPILAALSELIVDVELVPLKNIDPRLSTLDDRDLIVALHQLGWRGLVTNNYKMLKNPKELAAIIRTRLTVFAIEGVGDDPIRATGAVLLDLPGALKRMDRTARCSIEQLDAEIRLS